MQMEARPADAPDTGIHLLLADDDKGVRTLFATLLRATAGVASVLEAEDGPRAVELGRERVIDVAVLDLNMPHLDGVEAALTLRALRPSLQIALYSSDPELLRQRAYGLELPLFDKVEFERRLDWVERQARDARDVDDRQAHVAPIARKLDLFCSLCGYGIVSDSAPRAVRCAAEASSGRRGLARARDVPMSANDSAAERRRED